MRAFPYRGNPQLFILQPGDDYDACLLRYRYDPLQGPQPAFIGKSQVQQDHLVRRARREGAHGLFKSGHMFDSKSTILVVF